MAIVVMRYYVHLTDKALFEEAITRYNANDPGTGVGPVAWLFGVAPDTLSAEFGAELMNPLTAGYVFDPPVMTSDYFGPNPNWPTNVPQFSRKSGGWLGIGWLFPDTTNYVWLGKFVYAGSDESEVPGETLVAMPPRLWVDGFENGGGSASATGNAYDSFSPLASRHLGGMGMACRRGQVHNVQHNIVESGHAAADRAWERLYVRFRKFPNVTQTFWQMVGATSPAAGIRMRITVSGQIECVNSDAAATLSTVGTTDPLELNRWYKLDMLYRRGVAPDGFFKLYIGGSQKVSVNAGDLPAGTGISQVQNHTGTIIRDGDTAAHNGGWDFDDWIGSELPLGGSDPTTFPARDWNSGSKVVPLRAMAAAASNGADFAGPGGANANDFRFLSQRPVISTLVQGITTLVASPRAAVITDAARYIDGDPMNLGIAAVSVGASYIRTGGSATDEQVGLKLPGAAEVLAAPLITFPFVIASPQRGRLLYTGATLEPVSPAAGTELSFVGNSTAASTKTLFNIVGQAECIGNFFLEDYVPQADDPPGVIESMPPHWTNHLHQHWFEDAPWADAGAGTPSIIVNHGGTYVGNGTSQLLAFRTPPTWIVIRNTATHELTSWFVASPSGRTSFHEGTRSSSIPRVYIDPNYTPLAEDDQSFQTIVVIAGNNVAINANAVTYDYMCVQDAGMRFMESGALWEHAGPGAVERITPFNNETLTPEFLYVMREEVANSSTRQLYVKGLGLPATNLNLVFGAAITTALEMREGELATPAASTLYVNSKLQVTFVAMRRDDGSGDPGVKNVMQLASWTGDGAASRTVSLSPPTGRRPMWAIVVGSNGNARLRDPVHTGTNSQNPASDSNAASDGITAGGIDSISVASALNTSGVLFEALVIPGCDATAGNAGWGVNCESIPVEPIVPPWYPPWFPPTEPPEVPPGGGTPTIPPTGTITQCPGPSALVINMALGKIGIAKQVDATTLNTAIGAEITAARLHFDEDVKRILRDFPWPFATRYEVLTQVAGPGRGSLTVQAWSATQGYIVGSLVRVADVDYYCILANTGQPVTNPVYWSATSAIEANGDWVYAYRAPSLSLFNRRIVNNQTKIRRHWDMDPPDFRVGSDVNGPLIYSNEINAELEYTILDACVPNQGDALFREALAWRHACSIAPALTRSREVATVCWEMYQRLLRDARGSGSQETQWAPQGDPDWITGRN